LAPLGLGLAAASQAWFDVKDELGEGVLNSISINGENIQSRIGFADLKKKMADAHEYMLDMQEAIDNVTRERDEFMRQNNYNPEDAALSPSKYADLTKQVQDYNATINSIKNQMNANPETKQLDDAYKQLYSIKHAGFGQTLKNLDKSIRDQFTYDQYKEYVRDKRKQEQAQQYSDVLK
jgi:DNA repair ATPase RecN